MIFEINPRFSGGIPLTIAAGADFPRMLVQAARGREVSPGHRPLPRRLVDDELRDVGVRAGSAIGFSSALSEPASSGGGVMESTGIILQARMGSAPAAGQGARADRAPHDSRTLRASPRAERVAGHRRDDRPGEDDAVERAARALGAEVFRGPVDDVLSAFIGAAHAFGFTEIVRATADNPFVDMGASQRASTARQRGARRSRRRVRPADRRRRRSGVRRRAGTRARAGHRPVRPRARDVVRPARPAVPRASRRRTGAAARGRGCGSPWTRRRPGGRA